MQYDKIMRVAAYCRVSTDNDDQINSLESQKRYFSEYINRNPLWELVEVYADEGVTGTTTKKRYAFNRMINDAADHSFDLIITKEISRFARNTLDSIFFTRKLKDLGIGVLFMNDNINTLDSDAELRLTIMSSIAQEESRKTSERVKWGQKRRMEQGVVFGRDMLGYDIRNGKMYINKQGAEIVNLIFHKFVNEDKGTHVIARELREAGINTSTYMIKWSNTVILRVLRNEKYCGDLVQKKTFTPSYLNHEKKFNKGEEEFVVIKNHHEPIISRELFEKAQEVLLRRSKCDGVKSKYSNRYCFSGKIKCASCGCSYVARTKKRKDGSVYRSWRCYEATIQGKKHLDKQGNYMGCNAFTINEDNLKLLIMFVIKNLSINSQEQVLTLKKVIEKVFKQPVNTQYDFNRTNAQIDSLSQKRKALVELYLNNEIDKEDFSQISIKYAQQISSLKSDLKKGESLVDGQENLEDKLLSINSFINRIASGEQWDDTFYRNLLKEMVVYEDQTIDIYLNSLPVKLRYSICKPTNP